MDDETTRDIRQKLIEGWLRQKKVQLWADYFVADELRLRKAAEWFEKEMSDYERYVKNLLP